MGLIEELLDMVYSHDSEFKSCKNLDEIFEKMAEIKNIAISDIMKFKEPLLDRIIKQFEYPFEFISEDKENIN